MAVLNARDLRRLRKVGFPVAVLTRRHLTVLTRSPRARRSWWAHHPSCATTTGKRTVPLTFRWWGPLKLGGGDLMACACLPQTELLRAASVCARDLRRADAYDQQLRLEVRHGHGHGHGLSTTIELLDDDVRHLRGVSGARYAALIEALSASEWAAMSAAMNAVADRYEQRCRAAARRWLTTVSAYGPQRYVVISGRGAGGRLRALLTAAGEVVHSGGSEDLVLLRVPLGGPRGEELLRDAYGWQDLGVADFDVPADLWAAFCAVRSGGDVDASQALEAAQAIVSDGSRCV